MNNMFGKAYFGKPYKTRDGRKAIYIESYENSSHITVYRLMSEGPYGFRNVNTMQNGSIFSFRDDKDDIVSEWNTLNDGEELAKQYAENSLFGNKTKKQVAYNAYLAAYKKAINGE